MFVASKKKSLSDAIQFFENTDKIKEIHVVSRPHQRLMAADEAFTKINEIGSEKLQELTETNESGNNVYNTLDKLTKENDELKKENELLLICGSFFIMSDVR